MRFLVVGDIIGNPGRKALKYGVLGIDYDVLVVNVENSAGGFGITKGVYEELLEYGVDVMTSGNHIWDKKEVFEFIDSSTNLLRPANYPKGAPGRGYGIFEKKGIKFAVVNLMGRIFLEPHLENPFTLFDKIYEEVSKETNIILVDFHAEATSEKWAFGIHTDGKASVVYGTHTHVPTMDHVILKNGTAYVSDVGMSGCWYSVIGMKPKEAIERFLTGLPRKYSVEESGDLVFNAILVEVDEKNGKATNLERIQRYITREELSSIE